MSLYVVLLRGVNVGGKNLLPMKELKVLLCNAGFEQVETYIQSGNIVLQSATAPREKLAELISTHFQCTPELFVLSEREFDLAVANNPYQGEAGQSVHFYFCNDVPTLDLEKLRRWQSASERCQLVGQVFYLHAPDGIGRSKLVANIESCLGVTATGRNFNTMQKLMALKSLV